MATAAVDLPYNPSDLVDYDRKTVTCCPHCGGSVSVQDARLVRSGGWTLLPHDVRYGDVSLCLTRMQKRLFYELALTKSPMRNTVLARKIATIDDSSSGDSVAVLICRIRQKLRHFGIPDPITTHKGLGYSWNHHR